MGHSERISRGTFSKNASTPVSALMNSLLLSLLLSLLPTPPRIPAGDATSNAPR